VGGNGKPNTKTTKTRVAGLFRSKVAGLFRSKVVGWSARGHGGLGPRRGPARGLSRGMGDGKGLACGHYGVRGQWADGGEQRGVKR